MVLVWITVMNLPRSWLVHSEFKLFWRKYLRDLECWLDYLNSTNYCYARVDNPNVINFLTAFYLSSTLYISYRSLGIALEPNFECDESKIGIENGSKEKNLIITEWVEIARNDVSMFFFCFLIEIWIKYQNVHCVPFPIQASEFVTLVML